jgi:L-Ala-D/L-Glu epimerase
MKIISAHIFTLHIPFKEAFSHSTKTRVFSDSVVVKLTADTGESGFGEAVPRPYVTGESVASCCNHISQVLLPAVAQHVFQEVLEIAEPMALLAEISSLLSETALNSAIPMHASKAAVELACIDCMLKHSAKPFAALVKPLVDSVTYSSVITAGSTDAVRKVAQRSKQFGIKHIKVKVGKGDDINRIATIRDILGDSASIRLDANGAFDEKSAVAFIKLLQPYHIECIEQPVPRGDVNVLARIKEQSPIPLMVDESLVTMRDALELIENSACDFFNLRISKNGGCFQTLQLAEVARKAGMSIQFGCQVGETAILSAAGRHIAGHFPEAKYVEGSFGTHLLEEDVAREPVMFGYGGKAPLLAGSGLGIDVCEDILLRYSEKTINIPMA